MSDLVSHLLAAIEQEEQDAPNIHHKDCHSMSYVGVTEGAECDCGKPAAVLRRCAADRSIVTMYLLLRANMTAYYNPGDGGRLGDLRYVVEHLVGGYGLSVEEETTGE